MEGIVFFWNGRDSNPKFLVIDVAEGLYRVSHQSWSKAGKRQGNRNMYGRRFFLGISEFLVIDAEEGLAIFTIFLFLVDELV